VPPILGGPECHHGLARRAARQGAGELGDQHRDVIVERKALPRPRPHTLERGMLRRTARDEPDARRLARGRAFAGRIGPGEPLLKRGCIVGHGSFDHYIGMAGGKLRRNGRGCSKPPAITNGDATVAEKVLAAVRTGPSRTEIREYSMPDIPEDAALMKMEVAGICGTDVKLYKQPPSDKPTIMGHENIGYIAKAGREFTRRKGFKEGDLVFVEHSVMGGTCEWCHAGQSRHCETPTCRTNPDAIRYGSPSDEKPPHLWGGFAQYVYLPWNAVVHHVPKGVSPELAGLVTP